MIPSHLTRRGLVAGALATLAAPAAPALAQGLPTRDIAFGPHPRQKLDIYLPPGPVSRAPVAFFIYGGSWSSGDKGTYAFAGNAFASRGYVTVVADYRLVPEVQFPSFIEDGAAALATVRRIIGRYGGDAGRLHLVGHSAGAYNAMMLALDPRYLARAGVPRASVRAAAGLSGPYDFLPSTRRRPAPPSATRAIPPRPSPSASPAAAHRASSSAPARRTPRSCRATPTRWPPDCGRPGCP